MSRSFCMNSVNDGILEPMKRMGEKNEVEIYRRCIDNLSFLGENIM